MIRYIISMVFVALAVAFTGYAVTGFVPTARSSSILAFYFGTGVNTTGQCLRAWKAGQSNLTSCGGQEAIHGAAADGVITGLAIKGMVGSASAGMDCDASVGINDVKVGTVININDTNSQVGDGDWQTQSIAISKGDHLTIELTDGSVGTCNQVTDAWIEGEIWGYYTP